jgi:hypothetical protein
VYCCTYHHGSPKEGRYLLIKRCCDASGAEQPSSQWFSAVFVSTTSLIQQISSHPLRGR